MGVASPSSPPPAATAAANSPHPTYTKMITEALTELGGTSGRAAISGFIRGRFPNLPASHDALVSANLRRLISKGIIHKFASIYAFAAPSRARKDSLTAPVTKNSSDLNLDTSGRLHASSDDDGTSNDEDEDDYTGDDDDDEYTPACASYMLGTKRGRGRVSSTAQIVVTLDSLTTKRGRGRPRKEPEVASRIIKRGPGRPRKDASPFPTSALVTRPKKSLDLNLDPSQGLEISSDDDEDVYSGGGGDDDDDDVDYNPMLEAKRGHGRPRKRGCDWPCNVVSSTNGGGASSSLTKRARGRPRKGQNVCPSEASLQNGGGTMPMQTNGGFFSTPKRGHGRPRKKTKSM